MSSTSAAKHGNRTVIIPDEVFRRIEAEGPIRVRVAARMLGVSELRVVWLIRDGKLDGKVNGGTGYWTSRQAVERYLATRRRQLPSGG
jgi:hypothetical protein